MSLADQMTQLSTDLGLLHDFVHGGVGDDVDLGAEGGVIPSLQKWLASVGPVISGAITVLGNGNVGVNVANPSSKFQVFQSYADPTGSVGFVGFTAAFSFAANNANQINGVLTNFGNWTIPVGVNYSGGFSAYRNDAFVNNVLFAGTLGSQIGFWNRVGILLSAASAVITNSEAYRAELRSDIAGATITSLMGYRVVSGTIAGIVTNFFGFYMPALNVTGTVTNRWGIKIDDSVAQNYFAGPTQIGTTINNGALTVGGNVMPEADNSRNLGNASFRWAVANIVQLIATAARITTSKTPATSGATGTQGDFAWDASYLYICTAANTWRRVAHATW